MKKFFNNLKKYFTIKNILLFVLSLTIIILIVISIHFYKNKALTLPSDSDIKYGLENTFKSVSNISCNEYSKVTYNELVYKYTCTFDYVINEEVHKEYESCVDCMIKDDKWTCSISSSKCFK